MKPVTKVVSIAAVAGGMAVAALPTAATASGQTSAKSPFHPAPSQEVATLNTDHTYSARAGGKRMGTVSRKRPITGEATTLPVLGTTKKGKTTWLHVRMPGRQKNQHPPVTAWIKAPGTRLWRITEHIYVTIGPNTSGFSNRRRVWVYNRGKLVKTWLAVPGAPGRVTPTGEFFVEENINEGYHFPGGPFALATSARSQTYKSFDNGPGQVAIHGMADGLQAKPGTAVSHGCVRLPNSEDIWLARRTFQGTPVTIVR